MKRLILMGASLAVFAGAAAYGATGAFFSDSETSTGNTFTAGAIDLTVDSTQHYNNAICVTVAATNTPAFSWWQLAPGEVLDVPQYPIIGSNCDGTWLATNLGAHKFFNFGDIKPGDEGENTISLHVDNNDAYACVDVSITSNAENVALEPELGAGDNANNGNFDGELAQNLNFFAWADTGATPGLQGSNVDLTEGDNIWQANEIPLFSNVIGPASDALDGEHYTLADSNTGPLVGGSTNYIGFAWCAGTLTAPVPGTLLCNGAGMGNTAQTDSMVADIAFRVEQARNNPNFTCAVEVVRPLVGALNYVPGSPTCDITANDDGAASVGFTNGVNAIATAITQATAGQTICVAPGTYNEFTVDKSVTILGLSDPEGGTPATVIPSSASVTDLALVNANDVTIKGLKFDGNGIVTNGQAAGIRISPIAASLSGENITYNVVTNIAAAVGSAAKGIQWFTDTDSGFTLSNSTFANNTISNISSNNKGGYGIQTVGAMSNVAIQNNTISNTTGAWGAGVAVDTKNTTLTAVTGSSITLNQIMTGVSDGVSRFSVQVENKIDAAGVGVHQNNIETSLHGGGNAPLGTEGILDAQSNWWGTAAPVLLTDVFNSGANVTTFTLPEASVFSLN